MPAAPLLAPGQAGVHLASELFREKSVECRPTGAADAAAPRYRIAAEASVRGLSQASARPKLDGDLMHIYGELEPVLLADTLALLGRQDASGLLSCQSERLFKQVTFSDGCIVGVQSNEGETRIGRWLVRRGLLTEAELEQALTEQRVSGRRFGEALVRLGLIDQVSLDAELVEQAAASVDELFTWKEGQFVFESKPIRLPSDHPLWLETGQVLLHELVQFGSPLQEQLDLDGPVRWRGERPPPGTTLPADAHELLAALGKDCTIGQLQSALSIDTQRLLRLVMGLDALGIVQMPLRPPEPSLERLCSLYRGVLKGLFQQLDAERGGRGVEAFRNGWSAGATRTVAPASPELPDFELDAEGRLALLQAQAWNGRGEPELLQAVAERLDAAVLGILASLERAFGAEAAEAAVSSLQIGAQLRLERDPALRAILEQGRFAAPAAAAAGPTADAGPSASGAWWELPAEAAGPESARLPAIAAASAKAASKDTRASDRPESAQADASRDGARAALQDEVEALLQADRADEALVRCLLALAEDPVQLRVQRLLLQAAEAYELATSPSLAELKGLMSQELGEPGADPAELELFAPYDTELLAPPAAEDAGPAETQIDWDLAPAEAETAPAERPPEAETEGFLLEQAAAKLAEGDEEGALGLYRLVLAIAPGCEAARAGERGVIEGRHSRRRLEELLEDSRRCKDEGRIGEALARMEAALSLLAGQPQAHELLRGAQRALVESVQQGWGGPGSRPRLRLARESVPQQSLAFDEGSMLAQIDGSMDVRSLALVCGLGMVKACRLLLSLLEKGLIEMQPPAQGARGRGGAASR
jgi:hypothetical protein